MIDYTLNNNKRKYMTINKKRDIQDELCELHNKCDSLLAQCNIDMTNLIHKYNESLESLEDTEENSSYSEIDVTDLDYKFTELADYVNDYTQ